MAISLTFIIGQLGLGGAERQLYLLASGLLQTGSQVSLITLNAGKGDYWEVQLRSLGVTLHGIQHSLSRYHRFRQIQAILRKQRVEIVHSWSMNTNFYASFCGASAGTPIRLGSERANHVDSLQALGRWKYRLSVSGLDGLIVNSRAAAKYLNETRPRLPVFLVQNGVTIPIRNIDSERRSDSILRRKMSLSSDEILVGAVGSLVPRKNFGLLLEALSILARKGRTFRFVQIGDGPLRAELESQAKLCLPDGWARFVGAVPNACDLFPAFDLLCLPSVNQEGMPNVLMEASASGLPVVATAVGGASEVVEEGVTGFLLSPGDVGSLVDRLERLLTSGDLRHRMGVAGQDKMRREFSVESMVAGMLKVYEHVVHTRSAQS